MFQIYGMSGSFNTSKVIYTAEELARPYEYHELDFTKGDNKTPEHLARHPLGKTPTMTTPEGTLFESGAICRYLANTTKTELYGRNDFERARADQWMDFFSIHLGRWIGSYTFEKVLRPRFNMGAPRPEVLQEAEGYLEQQMGMVNNHLATNKHLVGETFTIADIFAFAYIENFETSEYPVANYKSIDTWFRALKERPCVVNGHKRWNQ